MCYAHLISHVSSYIISAHLIISHIISPFPISAHLIFSTRISYILLLSLLILYYSKESDDVDATELSIRMLSVLRQLYRCGEANKPSRKKIIVVGISNYNTQKRTRMHTHTYTLTYMLWHAHMCIVTYMHTYTYIQHHTRIDVHTHIHICTPTYIHTQTHHRRLSQTPLVFIVALS